MENINYYNLAIDYVTLFFRVTFKIIEYLHLIYKYNLILLVFLIFVKLNNIIFTKNNT